MKILVVDDMEDMLYVVETILKGNGYEVVTAKDGLEALDKLKEESIDMIISDILMPRMDGFQFCRECKKDDGLKKIPFIFYTATYTGKKDEEFALSLGAEKFIKKPTDLEVFLDVVKEVIEEHKEGGLIAPPEEPIKKEEIYLTEYSKRIIEKLEKKVLDLEKSKKQIKHIFNVLESIRNIIKIILREKDREVLLQKISDVLVRVRGYHSAWLGFLKDEKTFAIITGSPLEDRFSRFREQVLGGDHPSCINKALLQKDLFLLIDIAKDCRNCNIEDIRGKEQFAIIRLEYDHHLFGLLAITLAPKVYIDQEEKELLEELALDIAFGLYNIEMEVKNKLAKQELQLCYEKVQNTMEGILFTMGKITEIKDPYTAGHQQRISKLAVAIAKELNLPQDKMEGIRMAALLHDIGKICIPTDTLNKPSRLSEIEFGLIKDHPQTGYDILKSIDFSYPVVRIILQHHERLNGSGYPQGIKDEDILLEAKIIGVADVVGAMSSGRPYRSAHNIGEVLEEISKNKGILYNSEVVDACLKLFKEKGFKFE